MSLVESSNPGDVNHDAAVRLLAERAVLTRAICRELLEAGEKLAGRRPLMAMSLLLRWIVETMPECLEFRAAAGNVRQREPRPSAGLEEMVVPPGCEALLQELRAGADVGETLWLLSTADNMAQQRGDEARLRELLAAYWDRHGTAVSAPTAIEIFLNRSTP
jgi:hypothetical protein